MRTIRILLACLALLALSRAPAAAGEPTVAGGAAIVAIPIAVDTLNWGLVPDRDHALAWHLVPVAGPIVGLRANARFDCDDPLHGCTMQRGMFYIMDGLALASEVAGLAVMGTALARGSTPALDRLGLAASPAGAQIRIGGRW